MHAGKMIFSQVMEFLPMYEFRKCVQRAFWGQLSPL